LLAEEIAGAEAAFALNDAYRHISEHESGGVLASGECVRSGSPHNRDAGVHHYFPALDSSSSALAFEETFRPLNPEIRFGDSKVL
jgi:hypothetical protein